jgi:DNA-binding transcriptional ArsR family regulator
MNVDRVLFSAPRLAVIRHLIACGGRALTRELVQPAELNSTAALSGHLKILEMAGLVHIHRTFVEAPIATVILADAGRAAFAEQRRVFDGMTSLPPEAAAPP